MNIALYRHFTNKGEVHQKGLSQLKALNGEFKRSTIDEWFMQLVAFVIVAVSIALVTNGYSRFREVGDKMDLWFSLGFVCVPACGAYYLLRRSGYRYRFGAGRVQLLSRSGKILWDENIAAIQGASLRGSKSNDYLILHWPDAKRYVEIYESLENALIDPQHFKDAELGRENRERMSDDSKPAGPPWTCEKCGEENPGEFEVCWKCQSDH